MIDNNPQLSSMLMNVADIAPAAATAPPSRGGGAFGEALAGARSVHDLRESRESAAPSRREWARSDRTGDKPIGQDRARDVRSDAADRARDVDHAGRPDRTQESAADDHDAAVDDSTQAAADATTSTGEADSTDDTTASDATGQASTQGDGGDEQDAAAAAVAVAAAPATTDLDAIVVPTTTSSTQGTTTAVDAAIRMAISADGAATTTTAAAQAAAAGEQPVDGDVQELVATATQGAEDAADGDVQAGPTSPSTSRSSAASGPSPAQLAAATFVDGEEAVEAGQQQAAATKAATAAAATTQVAEGEGGDAETQLVQLAATVDTDAEVEADPDAPAAGPARSTKAGGAPGQAIAGAATEAARTEDADVPEAVQAARLNQQQSPTVAAAAQHQAAVQAKAAEAAAEEGGDDAAAPKLQPLPAQASPTANVARGEQVVPGIRVREGLLDATQQQRIDDIARQLSTRLKMSQAAGGSQVQLSLKPRELGDVTVQMQVREGVVAATVLVDKADTVRLLQTNLDELRRNLEQQGLSVQQFSVDVRGESGAGGANARAAADLHRNATRTSGGSASSVAGAAAVMPGYDGDDAVTADDVHEGDVSVLA